MSKVVLVLLVLSLMNFVKADSGYEKFINTYSKTRLIFDCLGEKVMREYYTAVQQSAEKCNTMTANDLIQHVPSASSSSTRKITPVEAMFGSPNSNSMQQPYYLSKQNPQFNNFPWQDLFDPTKTITYQNRRVIPFPVAMSPASFNQQPFMNFNSFRTKRSASSSSADQFQWFPETTVRALKDKTVNAINNFTCILRDLKYINSNNQFQFEYFTGEINAMQIDVELKKDILEGMEQCKQYATCMPFDQMPTALRGNMKRVTEFLKCKEKVQHLSCVKKDLRTFKGHFNLKGLDGVIDHLEEDDQMLAIEWAALSADQEADIFKITF